MSQDTITIPVSEVVYREEFYPRVSPDPAVIDRYAADLSVLPPIEVNQNRELIDGYHRWTAHKSAKAETILATVTETTGDMHLLELATIRNASHGLQLDDQSKKHQAIRFYQAGAGWRANHARAKDESEADRIARVKADIAHMLSVDERSVRRYLSDIDKELREARSEKIAAMWLACYTQEEIGAAVGLSQKEVSQATEVYQTDSCPKGIKLSVAATYTDADWKPPLYDIWSWGKRGDQSEHFGNSHVGIVDNLLYLFTEPFGIVVDPFGGGASTITVCKKRMRRYWVSDRKVPEKLKHEIGYREHDLVAPDGTVTISGPSRWGDVQLVYLDPPYWRQAEGQYSSDPTDLANMPLEQFNAALSGIIKGYAGKLKTGAHIALLIQPTQWKADDRGWPVYHDLDMIAATPKRLRMKYHIICDLSTQQSNAQQVDATKETGELLVRSRRLVVWEVV